MILCLTLDQSNNLIGSEMANASTCTGYIVSNTGPYFTSTEANQLLGAAIGVLALAWVFRLLIKSIGVL